MAADFQPLHAQHQRRVAATAGQRGAKMLDRESPATPRAAVGPAWLGRHVDSVRKRHSRAGAGLLRAAAIGCRVARPQRHPVAGALRTVHRERRAPGPGAHDQMPPLTSSVIADPPGSPARVRDHPAGPAGRQAGQATLLPLVRAGGAPAARCRSAAPGSVGSRSHNSAATTSRIPSQPDGLVQGPDRGAMLDRVPGRDDPRRETALRCRGQGLGDAGMLALASYGGSISTSPRFAPRRRQQRSQRRPAVPRVHRDLRITGEAPPQLGRILRVQFATDQPVLRPQQGSADRRRARIQSRRLHHAT